MTAAKFIVFLIQILSCVARIKIFMYIKFVSLERMCSKCIPVYFSMFSLKYGMYYTTAS